MPRMRTRTALTLAIALCATLVVGPVAAQDDAYEAAIASGDLASLIPEEFASSAQLLDERPFSLGPPSVDGPDAAAAREEFLALLDSAGVSLDDVTTLSGVNFEQGDLGFGAWHIPGVDPGDWFEPFYEVSLSQSFYEPVRQTVEIGPKKVLRLSDRLTDTVRFYYAMGEILWRARSVGDDALGQAFIDALPTVEGAALGAREPVAQIGTADDPRSQIPAEILDAPAEVQNFPIAALMSQVDQDDEQAVQDARDFEAMLADAGASIEQAEIIAGSAVSDDGGLSIVGLHVEGVDHSSFIDGAIPLFMSSQFDSPEAEPYQLGGKDVLRVVDGEGSAFSQPAYVYGVGETVWILIGQDEYVDALLATMP